MQRYNNFLNLANISTIIFVKKSKRLFAPKTETSQSKLGHYIPPSENLPLDPGHEIPPTGNRQQDLRHEIPTPENLVPNLGQGIPDPVKTTPKSEARNSAYRESST
jgi:hypothetical protein